MVSLSLQMANKQKPPPPPQHQDPRDQEPHWSKSRNPFGSGNAIAGTSAETGFRCPESNWAGEEGQGEVGLGQQQFQPVLEDDHIEQMIQELLHYGSIELCSVGSA